MEHPESYLRVIDTWLKYHNDTWVLGATVHNSSSTLTLHNFSIVVMGFPKHRRISLWSCIMRLYTSVTSNGVSASSCDSNGTKCRPTAEAGPRMDGGGGLSLGEGLDTWPMHITRELPPNVTGYFLTTLDFVQDVEYLTGDDVAFEMLVIYNTTGNTSIQQNIVLRYKILVRYMKKHEDFDAFKPFYVKMETLAEVINPDTIDASASKKHTGNVFDTMNNCAFMGFDSSPLTDTRLDLEEKHKAHMKWVDAYIFGSNSDVSDETTPPSSPTVPSTVEIEHYTETSDPRFSVDLEERKMTRLMWEYYRDANDSDVSDSTTRPSFPTVSSTVEIEHETETSDSDTSVDLEKRKMARLKCEYYTSANTALENSSLPVSSTDEIEHNTDTSGHSGSELLLVLNAELKEFTYNVLSVIATSVAVKINILSKRGALHRDLCNVLKFLNNSNHKLCMDMVFFHMGDKHFELAGTMLVVHEKQCEAGNWEYEVMIYAQNDKAICCLVTLIKKKFPRHEIKLPVETKPVPEKVFSESRDNQLVEELKFVDNSMVKWFVDGRPSRPRDEYNEFRSTLTKLQYNTDLFILSQQD